MSACTQPGQRKGRIFTRSDNQMHLRRQVLKQKDESMVDRVGLNKMVVVKHEDELVWKAADFIKQQS
ncbi:hypothetical protein PAENIP36_18820 [Paenibacillus sp. P36]